MTTSTPQTVHLHLVSTATGSPATTLTSYNNTMLDYTRAQYQQLRKAASSSSDTAAGAAQPGLGEPRSSSSTPGTAGSRESGAGVPGAASDFA
ncbi:hypothetical protein V497_02095 [Pseudogymnoascus sp. VKM F-4516 (FW-969)]|nr:hypothetical protein V497_02095 [Pseudogymnoascus sp. VKM F-4516 (FW-969)]